MGGGGRGEGGSQDDGCSCDLPICMVVGGLLEITFFYGGGGCVKNDGSMIFGFCLACGSVDPCFALFIMTAWLALGAPGALAALLFAIMRIGIQ